MWTKAFGLTPQKSQQQQHQQHQQQPESTGQIPAYALDDDNSESVEPIFEDSASQGPSSIQSSNRSNIENDDANTSGSGTSVNSSCKTTTTPLRKSTKLLKKLWCTPKSALKQQSLISSTDSDDLATDNDRDGDGDADSQSETSSKLYGVVISAPSSETHTSEVSTSTTPFLNNLLNNNNNKAGSYKVGSTENENDDECQQQQQQQRTRIRDLDADYDVFMEQKEHRMTSTTSSPDKIVVSSPNKRIGGADNALLATTSSLEHQDDIFLPNTPTSSNEGGGTAMDIMAETEMTISSPSQGNAASTTNNMAASTPDRNHHQSLPMKTPGMEIPTPSTKLVDESRNIAAGSGLDLPFPHALGSITESPLAVITAAAAAKSLEGIENDAMMVNQPQVDDDDAAFLPDDFKPDDFQESQRTTFTSDEVHEKIAEAQRNLRRQLTEEHQQQMEEFQEAAENLLVEHGSNWKRESEAEYTRLRTLLKEESSKAESKYHELINMTQTLEEMQTQLQEAQNARRSLERRVKELEETTKVQSSPPDDGMEQQMRAMEEELVELRAAQGTISKKEQDLVTLQTEKAAAEHEIADLTERLRVRVDSNNEALARLHAAEGEISFLKKQVADHTHLASSSAAQSDASLEELLAARAEIESLRNLRGEDEEVRESLKIKLDRAEESYRSEVTPLKSVGVSQSPAGDGQESVVEKMERQLQGMGKVLKRYKTERDDLRAKLQDTEKRHVNVIEIAVKQATVDMAAQVQSLEMEINRLRNESTEKTASEIEELTRQVDALKTCHYEEIAALKDKSSRDLEKARANYEEEAKMLQTRFEQKERDLLEGHTNEVVELKRQLDEWKTRHEQELKEIKTEHETETTHFEQSSSKMVRDLEQQLSKMLEMHQEEIELVRVESREETSGLKEEIQRLHSELNAGATERQVQNLKKGFEEDLERSRSEAKSDADGLRSKLNAALAERAEMATKLKEIQERHTLSIKEVRAEHGKELDELAEQLDLVEAEHNEKANQLRAALKEKEICLKAVTTNLNAVESRLATNTQSSEKLMGEVEALHTELEQTKAQLESIKQDYHSAMEEQATIRERACEEAQQMIIEKVERQFEERNAMYKELKRSYEESNSKVSVLERDLRFATKETNELRKRLEAREADLKDELAQAKAAIATSKADLIRAEQNHRSALDHVQDSEMNLRMQLEQGEATSRSLQSTLAVLVTEKEKLQVELNDLSTFCNELLSEMEGNKQQQQQQLSK